MSRPTEILLICGSGGVGKTTLSASLGLKRALAGKRAIVLTIDPAKRLASSLGLSELSDEPRRIDLSDYGAANGGQMWAMMLDTKRTFDRIIEKYAVKKETRDKILRNKIYQHLSNMLAGTQEYMAMERLYEIAQAEAYDVIVVDTPPMQNARDFLVAPERMMNMISNSMLHLLVKPSLALGKSGLKFFEKGSKVILKIFDRITGFAFLQDISEMLVAFQGLLGGFEGRAAQVRELLQGEVCRFITVCTSQENSIAETIEFHSQLKSFGYRAGRVVVNRVYAGPALTNERVDADRRALEQIVTREQAAILTNNYRNHLPLICRDKKSLELLAEVVGASEITTIPLFYSDVHDVQGLNRIARIL